MVSLSRVNMAVRVSVRYMILTKIRLNVLLTLALNLSTTGETNNYGFGSEKWGLFDPALG